MDCSRPGRFSSPLLIRSVRPIVPAVDTGLWTLKCQSCNKSFEIELAGGEKIVAAAQDHPCPHCNQKPVKPDNEAQATSYWNRGIGFRVSKKPR